MDTGFLYIHDPNCGSLSWFWRCKEYPCPLSPHLGLWRMLEVPDWGLASWSWFGYGHWSLIHPWSEFWLSILILKVQRTSMSFKSSFGALEDAGGSWLGFGILILIWIWSLVFDTLMIQILALSWFWRCKEHPVPLSPHLGLWGTMEASDWGLASWSWFEYGHWSKIHPWSKFWLSILILMVQRTSMPFKSWFGAFKDTGGS